GRAYVGFWFHCSPNPNLYGLITYHTIGAIEMPGMSTTVDAFYSTTIDRAGVVTPADPLPD
ncbi:hypothetical protein LO50_20830, partial [Stutzerimonas stutzeri]